MTTILWKTSPVGLRSRYALIKGIFRIFDIPLFSSTIYMCNMYIIAFKLYSFKPV